MTPKIEYLRGLPFEHTLADELRDNPPEVDKTPHIHFHTHDGERHAHEHVHPDEHAHSTLLRQ